LKHVDETYLYALLESEYRLQKDTEYQLEYATSPDGITMYGLEKVEASRKTFETEVERMKGRVQFITNKIKEIYGNEESSQEGASQEEGGSQEGKDSK